jgi:hypothetical protein
MTVYENASVIGNKADGTKADASENEPGKGGGIYLGGGKLTINSGANIKANEATPNNSGNGGQGGGIYLDQPSNTTSVLNLNGATIGGAGTDEGNRAKDGGGIFQAGGNLTIATGVSVVGNEADGGGGGGIHLGGGTLTMNGGDIKANTAKAKNGEGGDGGGIYLSGNPQVFMDSGTIANNAAAGNGDALYLCGNGFVLGGTATIPAGGGEGKPKQTVYVYTNNYSLNIDNGLSHLGAGSIALRPQNNSNMTGYNT